MLAGIRISAGGSLIISSLARLQYHWQQIGLGTARFAQPPPEPLPTYSGSLGTEGSFALSLILLSR